ncbi:metalloregulator ArsR/SmtB family transcription factor [Gordonia sp. CPCC 205515]|uniref:ArsR/SmtB family transcription factor n=1 Tax=Gordonia sp. CPCC 205515 TaxID=3140791 RepID=UPI003AF40946
MADQHTHGHGTHAHAPAGDIDIAEWAMRFDLLSDPHRLEILTVLHRNPGIIVGDLAVAVGRTETAVSQALRVLRHQGWVTSTRVGRSVSYRLDDDTVHDLLHWIGAGHQE